MAERQISSELNGGMADVGCAGVTKYATKLKHFNLTVGVMLMLNAF